MLSKPQVCSWRKGVLLQAGAPDYTISVWRWREEELVVAARYTLLLALELFVRVLQLSVFVIF
jgi:hypothetical protein